MKENLCGWNDIMTTIHHIFMHTRNAKVFCCLFISISDRLRCQSSKLHLREKSIRRGTDNKSLYYHPISLLYDDLLVLVIASNDLKLALVVSVSLIIMYYVKLNKLNVCRMNTLQCMHDCYLAQMHLGR